MFGKVNTLPGPAAADRSPGRVTSKVAKPVAGEFHTKGRARSLSTGFDDIRFRVGSFAYRDADPGLFGVGGNVFLTPTLRSSVQEVLPSRNQAVANARNVDRNNQFINSGITKRAVNTVGASLRLQFMPNWDVLGIDGSSEEAIRFVQQVENHFSLWGEDFRFLCDAHRQAQFGSMMLTSAREALGADGETFLYSRYSEERMRRYRGNYATFIELVRCDRLSTPRGRPALRDGRRSDGTSLIAGKELDEWGGATGYWLEDNHPGEVRRERTWTYVPRETEYGRPVGIHWFPRYSSGAQRAMPAIIASLRNVKMLDRFDDATLQTAIVNAILSVFIESEATSTEMLAKLTAATPSGSSSILSDLWDKRFNFYEEEELAANGTRIPVLPPGDKIHMETANRASDNVKDFRSAFMRGFAAQLNLSYEMFSGDYSETTFSSARAALIDIWRLITADRILFTQHVAYPVFVGFLEECFVRADELGIDWPAAWPDFYENMTAYSQCEFRGPGMGWVQPEQDAKASGLRQEQALTSPTFEASQQGQDFRDNVDQIARDHAYARSKKVIVPGMAEYAAHKAPPPPPAAEGADDGADDANDEGREGRKKIKRGSE
jgi:lambda family phage portal protein